jgi:hypothetical protein
MRDSTLFAILGLFHTRHIRGQQKHKDLNQFSDPLMNQNSFQATPMSRSLHHVYEACPCSQISGFVGVTNAGLINADVRRASNPKTKF